MQDGPKVVWNIPYVSVALFPSLKQNFIAYHSSNVSDCIFELYQFLKPCPTECESFFNCSTEPIDRALTDTNTPGESGPVSNDNDGVVHVISISHNANTIGKVMYPTILFPARV